MDDVNDLKAVYRLVAAVLVVAFTLAFAGYQVQRVTPGTKAFRWAQESARALVAEWPEQSRLLAHVQLERLGPPDNQSREALTWTRRAGLRRIAVHAYPTRAPLEHVVDYRVPPERLGALNAFQRGITVDAPLGEISARSERRELNFLALNLAHEIASERRSVEEAAEFYDRVKAFAAAGKTSPYLEGLTFQPKYLAPPPLGRGFPRHAGD